MKNRITTEDIFTHGEFQGNCDTPVYAVVEFNDLPANAPSAIATKYRVPDDMVITLYDSRNSSNPDDEYMREPYEFDDRWIESYVEITDKNVIISYYAKHHDTELCIRFPKEIN